MTTRLPSLGSLRERAASLRRGHLAGSTSPRIADRDLDRVASDLLALSQLDPDRPEGAAEQAGHPRAEPTEPVDLRDRRARGDRPAASGRTAPHARAS